MSEQMELVKVPNVQLTATGAEFKSKMEFKEWIESGRQLCQVGACVQWWIGDWLIAGESFRQRDSDGKMLPSPAYDAALQSLPYEKETLQNMASVSRAVHLTTRCAGLTWSHHREVSGLTPKEQSKWLGLAKEGSNGVEWAVTQLREAIRASKAPYAKDNEPDPEELVWAKPATDLFRMLRTEERQAPLDQWTAERRASVKLCVGKEMQYIHDFYERLCAV